MIENCVVEIRRMERSGEWEDVCPSLTFGAQSGGKTSSTNYSSHLSHTSLTNATMYVGIMYVPAHP